MLRFGLVGKSLAHSFSREYFHRKFSELSLADYRYDNFELSTLDGFSDLLRIPHLRGLNVTIPYKTAVLPYLHALSQSASEIHAVNTILINDGFATGYNTDVDGFELTLKHYLPVLRHSAPALVLGTGGAASAVTWVLAKAGLAYYSVSRNPSVGQLAYTDLDDLNWELPRLIVNTTPLGMYPYVDAMPSVPTERLNSHHVVIDLIYNPAETRLLQVARRQRAQICNGLPMLHGQAEAAWSIWTAPTE